MRQQRCGMRRMQLTESEVPWLEDGEIRHSPQARSAPMSEKPISPMRQRMIESRAVRKFGDKTQNDYIPRLRLSQRSSSYPTWQARWIC
jgi:hypothetical protein